MTVAPRLADIILSFSQTVSLLLPALPEVCSPHVPGFLAGVRAQRFGVRLPCLVQLGASLLGRVGKFLSRFLELSFLVLW